MGANYKDFFREIRNFLCGCLVLILLPGSYIIEYVKRILTSSLPYGRLRERGRRVNSWEIRLHLSVGAAVFFCLK